MTDTGYSGHFIRFLEYFLDGIQDIGLDTEVANPYQSTSESKVANGGGLSNSRTARFYTCGISEGLSKITQVILR